jgi:hypothetical protein
MAEKAKNATNMGTIVGRRSSQLCSSYISSTPISGNQVMGGHIMTMTGKTLPIK